MVGARVPAQAAPSPVSPPRAPAVAGKLEAHISHIETGLRYSLRPGNREPLAAVLADASALAGWQAIDMGRLPRAREHFERATAAAREAGHKSAAADLGAWLCWEDESGQGLRPPRGRTWGTARTHPGGDGDRRP